MQKFYKLDGIKIRIKEYPEYEKEKVLVYYNSNVKVDNSYI